MSVEPSMSVNRKATVPAGASGGRGCRRRGADLAGMHTMVAMALITE